MAKRANHIRNISFAFIVFSCLSLQSIHSQGVSLYTPYTKISVPPGESVEYTIEIKNGTSNQKKIDLGVSGLPGSWDYTLKAGGYSVQQLTILPGERKSVTLKVDIPLKVNKGNELFKVVARNYASLPLTINVSEQGTFKTEFTSDQVNLEGHAKANFTFSSKLKNETGEKQVYALQASPPRGWNVIFKPGSKQSTAVEIDANGTSNMIIEVKPPYNVEAGTYKIPTAAVNRSTRAELELEVVITGTYEMDLTSPTGLLSTKITAGSEKKFEMMVRNTGSSKLEKILFRSSLPKNWEVSFEPDTIPLLEAGQRATVMAKIKAAEKAIPGDYVAKITAYTPEVSSMSSLRVSVKTPLLWGWLGILIVVATIGIIYFLFRKYGRR